MRNKANPREKRPLWPHPLALVLIGFALTILVAIVGGKFLDWISR